MLEIDDYARLARRAAALKMRPSAVGRDLIVAVLDDDEAAHE